MITKEEIKQCEDIIRNGNDGCYKLSHITCGNCFNHEEGFVCDHTKSVKYAEQKLKELNGRMTTEEKIKQCEAIIEEKGHVFYCTTSTVIIVC